MANPIAKTRTTFVTTVLLLMCAVVLSTVSCSAHAGEAEKNVARFVASAAIGAAATDILADEENRVLYGTAIGTIPSVVKELYDTRTKHGAQANDLVVGLAGAVLGAVLADKALEAEDVAPVVFGSLAGPAFGTVASYTMSDKPLSREDVPKMAATTAAVAIGGWPVIAAISAFNLFTGIVIEPD